MSRPDLNYILQQVHVVVANVLKSSELRRRVVQARTKVPKIWEIRQNSRPHKADTKQLSYLIYDATIKKICNPGDLAPWLCAALVQSNKSADNSEIKSVSLNMFLRNVVKIDHTTPLHPRRQ